MKRIFLSILLVGLGVNASIAQIGDLKNKLKEAKGGNEAPAVSSEELVKLSPLPQQEVAKLFFDKYNSEAKTRISAYAHVANLELSNEKQPEVNSCTSVYPEDSKVEQDANGNYLKFLLNFNKSFENSCRPFEIIHPTGAYAFGFERMSEKYIDGTLRVYSELVVVFDNFILIGVNRDNGKFKLKGDFHIVGTKSVLKQLMKSYTYETFRAKMDETLQAYYDQMQVLLKGGDQKMAEEKRAKYGIKGKDVVSLAIVPFDNNKLFQGQSYNFDIIATLKDGSKLSTRQGFKDEYDIQVEGLELVKHTDVDGSVTSWYEIAKTYIPKNDKIRVVVKSKFHPTVKPVEFSQNVDYENCEWTFNDNGDQSSTEAYRKAAGSFRIEVKSAIDVNTKKECFEYKVWNKGEVVAHCKQVKTKPIVVNAKGGAGKKPNFGNQNGGNGGSITLVKDPSAKNCVIIYDVNGGPAYTAANSSGAKGTYTETEQKLSW